MHLKILRDMDFGNGVLTRGTIMEVQVLVEYIGNSKLALIDYNAGANSDVLMERREVYRSPHFDSFRVGRNTIKNGCWVQTDGGYPHAEMVNFETNESASSFLLQTDNLL